MIRILSTCPSSPPTTPCFELHPYASHKKLPVTRAPDCIILSHHLPLLTLNGEPTSATSYHREDLILH